ncbi:folate-binding protein YgfZ [Phragmitibacter flavus]|uniref:Folate-binding protein YgfZ n=1 Tax=Phragmitibacter flavus TaxID=2576071 RepID=A0A5R8KK80_9BACT|nr:folate-binding protein YgfZ [Phragmitibacter flavus]TLD72355.1 folate-binding protein YgfZ [Phragmitibacter flavus]
MPLIDLSDRAKFLLTGEDRVRYLNGQVTNDVRKATADRTQHACVTNLKGRIEGDLRIHISQSGAEGLWLDTESGLRESLAIRLERYIIADDAELQDVTDDWQLFHIFGPDAEPFMAKAGTEGILLSDRFGIPGVDLWLAKNAPTPEFSGPKLTPEQANQLRIQRGIPRWPEELNPDAFPQEAGLETTAMDFHKGCYIGQEILSRIKTTGKMPNRLFHFSVPKSGLTLPESPSTWQLAQSQPDGSHKNIGVITSIAQHPVLDQFVALAYVRQAWDGVHSLLLVTDPASKIEIPIQVEPLPPQ